MKNIILNSFLALSTIVSFSSCEKTEGALYSGDANKISFLSKATSMNMSAGVLEIPIGRTSTADAASFNVTLTAAGAGYTDVFKVVGPVVFSKGDGKAYANVTYGDFSKIDPSTLSVTAVGTDINVGVAFPFALNIAPGDASISKIAKTDIVAANALTFKDAGTAVLNSEGGWEESVLAVKVKKANEANVYKVVTPFGPYSIAFMIKSDGKTVVCPDQVIYKDATNGPVSITGVTGTHAAGVVTLKVAAYKVAAGSYGSGVEIIKLP